MKTGFYENFMAFREPDDYEFKEELNPGHTLPMVNYCRLEFGMIYHGKKDLKHGVVFPRKKSIKFGLVD